MELDPRQLANLLAVAKHGSFSRAAAERGVSQPALSNSIRQLEMRIGTRVLDRDRNGARLTEVGETLMRHAQTIEAEMTRAGEEVQLQIKRISGPLLIGVTPVAVAHLVPRALERLKRDFPRISIVVHETVFHEAMAALLKGTLDVMVGPVGVYPKVDGIEEERLVIDPFSIIVRAGHRLSHRRSMSLQALRDADWVLPSDQSAFHRQIEALFITAGLPWPEACIATNSMVALKSIVMHTDYVTVMPRLLVAHERANGWLHCITLNQSGRQRALGLNWARDRQLSPVAAQFAKALRDIAREPPRRGTPAMKLRRRSTGGGKNSATTRW
jgi:molybdate transport repressor ModE-like protein